MKEIITIGVMAGGLIVLSAVALLGGMGTLTQATQGVGLICIACYMLILARIAQASAIAKQMLNKMDDQ